MSFKAYSLAKRPQIYQQAVQQKLDSWNSRLLQPWSQGMKDTSSAYVPLLSCSNFEERGLSEYACRDQDSDKPAQHPKPRLWKAFGAASMSSTESTLRSALPSMLVAVPVAWPRALVRVALLQRV